MYCILHVKIWYDSEVETWFSCPVTAQDVEGVDMAIASDHYEKYGIPSLEELGKSLGKIWEGFSPDIGLVQWAVLIQLSIELL